MLFLAALVAIGLVSCNNEDVTNGFSQEANGETALLKVNLKAAGSITRATPEEEFKYGLNDENKVGSILFFFFDANGAAYQVQGADNYVSDYILAEDPSMTDGTAANIGKISDAVLVIKKSQVAPPTQMVALVNAPKSFKKAMSLSELESEVVDALTTDGCFIMSSSVYKDELTGVKVVTSPITEDNIFTTTDKDVTDLEPGDVIDDATGITPVDIYVERVAAKVEVKINEDCTYETGVKANGKDVYAKVLGWNVTNSTNEAYMIKSINPAWTNLSFTPWNNPAFYRSYWAATDATPSHANTFAALMTHTGAYDYYFENTLPANDGDNVVDGSSTTGNQTPQLLVAAQLVDEDGAPVAFGKWYNVDYTVEGVKTAMVASIASKVYVKDTDEEGKDFYRTIGVEDVEFYQVEETTESKRYEVKIKAQEGVTYYDPSTYKQVNGEWTGPEAFAADAVAAIFNTVDPAQIWTEGYTYYYTNIKHFGDATGLVRNHWYEITLETISGLGTPVYDITKIITPEKPVEQEALNLSARINILSWHLVSNNVALN